MGIFLQINKTIMYFYIVRIFILVVPFLFQFRTLFFYGEYRNALRTWKMRCDESKMVSMNTSMLSLMVVLYLKKWLSIHNGHHLNNVGNCLEHFSM